MDVARVGAGERCGVELEEQAVSATAAASAVYPSTPRGRLKWLPFRHLALPAADPMITQCEFLVTTCIFRPVVMKYPARRADRHPVSNPSRVAGRLPRARSGSLDGALPI